MTKISFNPNPLLPETLNSYLDTNSHFPFSNFHSPNPLNLYHFPKINKKNFQSYKTIPKRNQSTNHPNLLP